MLRPLSTSPGSLRDRTASMWRALGCALGYLALAGALTAPVWSRPRELLIGTIGGPDLVGTAWTWWWTSHALGHGLNPFRTDLMYFPVGLYPVAQFNLVDALWAAPLYWLFGPVLGYNLTVLTMLGSVGWAVHWLARRAGASLLPAVFAAASVISSGYLLSELEGGRIGQMWITLLVLGVGLWWRLWTDPPERSSARLAVLTGVVSALCFFEYWYYGLFLGFAVAMIGLPQLAQLDRRRVGRLALATVVLLLLVLPVVALLTRPDALQPGMSSTDGYIDHGAIARGEGGLNWAITGSEWVGWPIAWSPALLIPVIQPQITLIVLALAPLLVLRGRRRWSWLALAVFGYLLSLGPFPLGRDGRIMREIGLPYLWLYDVLPYFKRFWWPYRGATLMGIGLTMLAATNLTELMAEARRWPIALPLLALAVGGAEVIAKSDRQIVGASLSITPSPVYQRIEGALITCPLFGKDTAARYALWIQQYHHQPLLYGLGGHLSGHRPPAVDALVRDNELLRTMVGYETAPPATVQIRPDDVRSLRERGFEWYVLDDKLFTAQRSDRLRELSREVLLAVFGPPELDEDRVMAWHIDPPKQIVLLDPAPGAGEGAGTAPP